MDIRTPKKNRTIPYLSLTPRPDPERVLNYGLIYKRILMKMGKILLFKEI